MQIVEKGAIMKKSLQCVHKKNWTTVVSLNLQEDQEVNQIDWLFAGMMKYQKNGNLEIGIQAKSDKEDIAFFEIHALFELKHFDPNNAEHVEYVRLLSFGFLFPYMRGLANQAFALAGVPIKPFPVVYLDRMFKMVQLEIEP